MRLFRLTVAALVAAFAVSPATSAQDYGGQFQSYADKQNIIRPGLGEDPGELQGDAVSMPAGVTVSKVEGLNPGGGCNGGSNVPYAVQVCMTLCNESGRTMVITLPKGTALKNTTDSRVQSGILAQPVRITIPPKPCPRASTRTQSRASPFAKGIIDVGFNFQASGKGVIELSVDEDPSEEGFQVTLGGYCLNEGMSPSEDGASYELGPVLSDPDIRELLAMIGDRALDDDQGQILQTAIYSITEGRGLTPADRAALRGL